MATIHTKYRCEECGEIHEEEGEARECCPPEISEIYQCSVCHKTFADEDVADEHCWEHSDDEPAVPTHAELEAAGQQRLPL
jgi:DNA-directed RNA polymerase subunit RPC12/RpoP